MLLKIEATAKTPKLKVNPEKGLIQLAGISIPEDPRAFYQPFQESIDEYVVNPKEKTLVEFKLEYFNTSTTLIIRNLLRKLSELQDRTQLVIKWYFEEDDEDMAEVGGELKVLFPFVEFEIIEVQQF
ncbi:MAG: DUF1987 domain-containing protein [Crocinitomicaceae bacterium]